MNVLPAVASAEVDLYLLLRAALPLLLPLVLTAARLAAALLLLTTVLSLLPLRSVPSATSVHLPPARPTPSSISTQVLAPLLRVETPLVSLRVLQRPLRLLPPPKPLLVSAVKIVPPLL
jgi:hypothetical protein